MSNQISLESAKVCSSLGVNPVVITKTTNLNPSSIKKIALKCPDCGVGMSLREGRYGLSYFCNRFPYCRGSHKASKKGKPLGFAVNQETRSWRVKAHNALERLYKGGDKVMTKTEAYGFLAYGMGLSVKQAHISRLNLEQCQQVIELLDFNE
ncbi:MAG: hypothetical protein FD167_376 [bacterium]|nr:MAG: hypothetical protein FD167_376 [bacterium]